MDIIRRMWRYILIYLEKTLCTFALGIGVLVQLGLVCCDVIGLFDLYIDIK